jgi:tetratricopeptide (TPR) repeat protein
MWQESDKKNFFISYNKADRAWAEWIAWQLEEAGYSTVNQAWDFRPGGNFILDMQRAATQCERTIAVLSPDYLRSKFTQPEWAAAFAQDPTGEKSTLLPVRVRECDLTGLLPQTVYIDLLGLEESAARDVLLASILKGRAKPLIAPAYPSSTQHAAAEKPRFPGLLPPIWNVPHNRNPNFTGREALLESLRTALTSKNHAALTQAIYGLGGVGKTQIAVEYVYRFVTEYEIVWWLRAEEPSALAADYAGLAAELGLPEKDINDQSAIVKAVRHHLGQITGWMLIFDNAQDRAEIRDYLPQSSTGHVIITSRNQNWGGMASALPVEIMGQDEAVEFLLKRTGQVDEEATGELAEELDYLPLALEQAGAHIDETSLSIGDYLSRFRTHRQDLLRRGSSSTDYPDTVATTWDMSFQRVRSSVPAGEYLMNLCAFLAPDDIPLNIVREGAPHLPDSVKDLANPVLFDEAIASLRRYSLIKVRDSSFLSVHRLVQAAARDRLSEGKKELWALSALLVISFVFPRDGGDVKTWPLCASLVPHVLAVLGHGRAHAYQAVLVMVERLLNSLGLYYRARAEFGNAKAALTAALTIAEHCYNKQSDESSEEERTIHRDELAASLNNLALLLEDQGDFVNAQKQLERALSIYEEAYGPNDQSVATCGSNLGTILRKQDDLVNALAHYQRALAINESIHGAEHSAVAHNTVLIGIVLEKQGDLEGALACYQKALAINEKIYGIVHATIAENINGIGAILAAQGDLNGAIEHYRRSLAIMEELYGDDHPLVAVRLNNIGNILIEQEDLEGARAYFERALEIDKKSYGENHHEVAIDLTNLGRVLQEQGDLARAQAHFERGLAINEATYGPNHSEVARDLNNLGENLLRQLNFGGARIHLERALTIAERAVGVEHPIVATILGNLGVVLKMQGNMACAQAYLERSLAILEKSFGPNHSDVVSTHYVLGQVLIEQGALEEARMHIEQTLAISGSHQSESSASVANSLGEMAVILRAQGDLVAAQGHLERALKIKEECYGPESLELAEDLANLGAIIAEQGDLMGARAYFERSLAIGASYEMNSPEMADIHRNFGTVLQVQGDMEGAREQFEKSLAILKSVHGLEHPSVARLLIDLGVVLKERRSFPGALSRFKGALSIVEKAYGSNHPEVAVVLNEIASLCELTGSLHMARKQRERILAISEAVNGPDHPDLAEALLALGLLSIKMQDFAKARTYLRRSLPLLCAALGENHPSTTAVRQMLVSISA